MKCFVLPQGKGGEVDVQLKGPEPGGLHNHE